MPATQAVTGVGTLLQRAGVTLLEAVKLGGPTMKRDLKDATNFLSPSGYREFISGLAEGGTVTGEGNYVPHDATQGTLRTDFENGTMSSWAIVMPNALGTWTFNAFVESITPSMPLDDRITVSFALKITGKPVLS